MNALLNEYAAWRDQKIKEAFENCVENPQELEEAVYDHADEWIDKDSSITLDTFKEVLIELFVKDVTDDTEQLILTPLLFWVKMNLENENWNELFDNHVPHTDESQNEEECED